MTGIVAAMIVGAGLGAGMWLITRAMRRPTVDLATVATRLATPGRPVSARIDEPDSLDLAGWQARLSRGGLTLLDVGGGSRRRRLGERLRILDTTIERHAYEKSMAALAGIALPLVTGAALAAGGASPPAGILVAAAVVLGIGGFLYPDMPLNEKVAARQRAFRHALSGYLDLVTIILAGGGGIESALHGAADAGDGWAFTEIRTALRRAAYTGRTPWETFDELGDQLGIHELRDLAASVSLAGGHGAVVRRTLTARADALRAQQSTEIEARAETQSEKMILPVTVMLIGLTLFIGYAALDAIGTDGGTAVTTRAAAP